jgi:hypothetical protein
MQRQPVDELPQRSPSIMEQRPDLRLEQSRDKRPAGATNRHIALAWIIQIVDSPVRVRIPHGQPPIVLQELCDEPLHRDVVLDTSTRHRVHACAGRSLVLGGLLLPGGHFILCHSVEVAGVMAFV